MTLFLSDNEFNKIKDTYIMDFILTVNTNDEECIHCKIKEPFPSQEFLVSLFDILQCRLTLDIDYFGTADTIRELGLD